MSNPIAAETLAKIENAVPVSVPTMTLDIWKQAGGISHCHVKNALKVLLGRGRVLRTQKLVNKRPCFHYQRVT